MEHPKREMLKMAAKLFEEKGYHKCSLQDIVQPLGLTKGSFYYYFSSKEELLYNIHDEMVAFSLEKLEELSAQSGLRAEDKLYIIVKCMLLTIHHYRSHVAVFFQEKKYLNPDDLEKIRAKRKRFADMVYHLLAEDYEKGRFKSDLDLKVVILGIFGMCNWAYQWYEYEGRLDIEAIIDTFYAVLKDGFLAK
jgi:AcrR family transcriptional regulator